MAEKAMPAKGIAGMARSYTIPVARMQSGGGIEELGLPGHVDAFGGARNQWEGAGGDTGASRIFRG
ncbi:hypothetical protein [Pseudomonas borbori]|uniref:Uncharacterized protein n=1 Tax=Pseudomonas borbori TaxID=289003 RepID=A0A1I5TB57_9PSED|nr:hypothetical protein [Pseudomonas borbori]SFP80285.1 hypothetical protein SAMN05216190_11963 [Pseudomonas borbori]